MGNTVDGRDPADELSLVVYPRIYQALCIPRAAGFHPSRIISMFMFFRAAYLPKRFSAATPKPFRCHEILGGGFKHFLFSPLPGERIQFDEHIFEIG